jgi:hypothetical protein
MPALFSYSVLNVRSCLFEYVSLPQSLLTILTLFLGCQLGPIAYSSLLLNGENIYRDPQIFSSGSA